MQWQPLPPELWPFPHFLCYLLRELNLADTPTLRQLKVAEWLENGPDRSITTAYRGLGKSFASGAYALWRLRHDPFAEKILISAATAEKADEAATLTTAMARTTDSMRCPNRSLEGMVGFTLNWGLGGDLPLHRIDELFRLCRCV